MILKAGNITAIRRLFIFPIKISRIKRNDINKLEIKRTGSIGEGKEKIEHFKIEVLTANSKKITIAEDIDGEKLAKLLKGFLNRKLFLNEQK